MNTNNIKKYAPKARTAFIAAMTKRAALFGIRESSIPAMGIEPLEQKGDLALIGDRAFPASIIRPRAALVQKVAQLGFAQAMEQAAYSWFNRLCAIRFMELKGYLDHGLRVLSHPSQPGGFQILDDCLNIELPGLDKQRITALKLDGNKDEALYRELLLAQCHALHQAMPFLFEAIDDQTELLLPDNLTKTDSLIRELVDAIPEQDWQDVEIIGWLYQFYISEKKDQVIGKVVKSEDIPAATQLFTPNWIVKYMVQNSLGAQWLATYPDSPLKVQMEYYIEPAEQTDEVNAQLAAITPSALNPEELTLIDPACGSGHILVEGYELFKAIYLERGYRQRDLPQLILEKNLFGLDIDERAAQLTGFALMMKGREDDRRLFERGVKLNVMALVDSAGFDPEVLAHDLKLADYGLQLGDLTELKRLFEHATTFGSLIQVPAGLASSLPALKQLSEATSQDLFVSEVLKRLGPLVQQAELLAAQYDGVVANPPYMGGKFYCAPLKQLVNGTYKAGKADLYGAFTLRNIQLAKDSGHIGMITIPNWMYLSSFDQLRGLLLECAPISVLVDNGRGVWGSDFGSCSYILKRCSMPALVGRFLRLFDKQGSVANNEELERRFHANQRYSISNCEFKKIPGSPIAYWVSEALRHCFSEYESLHEVATPRAGMITGDNAAFVRTWPEVSISRTGFDFPNRDEARLSNRKWFPYQKGGQFRKWFGNNEFVVDWEDDGHRLRTTRGPRGNVPAHAFNEDYIFQPNVNWSAISISFFSSRVTKNGSLFDAAGSAAFPGGVAQAYFLAGFLNSKITREALGAINPTVNFQAWNIGNLPLDISLIDSTVQSETVTALTDFATTDWDAYERSWDFQSLPILRASTERTRTLDSSYTTWISQNRDTIAEMKRLEEENNRLFIDAYGLADELTPDVPIEQITLTVNPAYRYGGKMTEEELWTRFREDSMQELASYAIGCMMGRYSLDEPGLIYAHSGNEGFDASRYPSFPADDDGIVPLTDKEWFADDAANRLVEFIAQAWDKTHLEANLRFLADNLSPKKGEGSRDTLRRYLCDSFFKDHLQTYKKRPIYWLFSSGKQKAFQCLVYLHRYNASTLSRMRTLHVIPLSAKLNSYANKLEQDIDASTSTAEKKAMEKQLASLHKQQAELATFDEKLRHHADLRITLDLDDGVKVNYGKFGDLLAEVKAVTGGASD
jgi:type II restriction/modification system DNA methylase subunit YeeA